MKVVALGKIAQNKLCNLSPGVCFKEIDSQLIVQPTVYMKINLEEKKSVYSGTAVELETGNLVDLHPSTRVQIFQDACIVLDPIDRS